MFMPSSQRKQQASQLREAMTQLRAYPQKIAARLDAYREQMRNIYRLREQLRDEAWKQQLTDAVLEEENALLEMEREAQAVYQDAEVAVNALAQSVAVPDANADVFLTQFAIAIDRFKTHAEGFASDDSTALALRRLREAGAFARDQQMALACWLYAGELVDVHSDWVLTKAEWENLKPLLPTEYRQLLQQAQELGEGWARVTAAFRFALQYVRNTAQQRVELPAWSAQNPNIEVVAA